MTPETRAQLVNDTKRDGGAGSHGRPSAPPSSNRMTPWGMGCHHRVRANGCDPISLPRGPRTMRRGAGWSANCQRYSAE
ncbi:MAG: hypothetical protein QOJ52_3043, partial [Acidimicrobiaceae bacterium]|nr:hypothetical protein [Acidimicrobiaceae bacterium]